MGNDFMYPGERFLYTVGAKHIPDTGSGSAPQVNDFKLFVVLDINSMYWFWDGWTQDIDFVLLEDLPPGTAETIKVLDFEWPDVEGKFSGIRIWSALLEADTNEMHGEYDYDDFDYGAEPDTPTPDPDPTATPQTAELTVLFNNDDAPIDYDCGDERLYCFGEQHFPTSYFRVATLRNTGGSVVSVNMNISGSDADLFDVEESMNFQLNPGSDRDLRIRFDPTGVPGLKYGTISIDGPGPTEVIDLRGHYVY